MRVQPYLFFDGRCEEALTFYQTALGAEILSMMRFKESPLPEDSGAARAADRGSEMGASAMRQRIRPRISQRQLIRRAGMTLSSPPLNIRPVSCHLRQPPLSSPFCGSALLLEEDSDAAWLAPPSGPGRVKEV